MLGEGQTGVVAEPGLLKQRKRLVVQTAQVVVADAADFSLRTARQQPAVAQQRIDVEPIGIVAVQADLAVVSGE